MTQAEAASVKIVDIPCLSLTSILELRALIDSVLASRAGEMPPDHGGLDGDTSDLSTTRSIRGAASHDAHSGRTDEVSALSAVAADGGDDAATARGTHHESVGGER
jgi:hypothetical protein